MLLIDIDVEEVDGLFSFIVTLLNAGNEALSSN